MFPQRGLCGRGDPAAAAQRALLRASVARCGGGKEASPGRCLLPLSGTSEFRRLSSPGCPPSGRAVGVCCPRPVGASVRTWAPGTVSLACMPCGGLRAAGVAGGPPGGGEPLTVVRGVWCQALSPPAAARPLGQAARPRCPCFPGAGGLNVGTQHRPHSVRSCELALRAVGMAGGRPRGGASRHCEGRLRSSARPPPTAHPRGGQLGSAVEVLWAWVCGRGGPALFLWRACPAGGCAPPQWRKVVPGGGDLSPL